MGCTSSQYSRVAISDDQARDRSKNESAMRSERMFASVESFARNVYGSVDKLTALRVIMSNPKSRHAYVRFRHDIVKLCFQDSDTDVHYRAFLRGISTLQSEYNADTVHMNGWSVFSTLSFVPIVPKSWERDRMSRTKETELLESSTLIPGNAGESSTLVGITMNSVAERTSQVHHLSLDLKSTQSGLQGSGLELDFQLFQQFLLSPHFSTWWAEESANVTSLMAHSLSRSCSTNFVPKDESLSPPVMQPPPHPASHATSKSGQNSPIRRSLSWISQSSTDDDIAGSLAESAGQSMNEIDIHFLSECSSWLHSLVAAAEGLPIAIIVAKPTAHAHAARALDWQESGQGQDAPINHFDVVMQKLHGMDGDCFTVVYMNPLSSQELGVDRNDVTSSECELILPRPASSSSVVSSDAVMRLSMTGTAGDRAINQLMCVKRVLDEKGVCRFIVCLHIKALNPTSSSSSSSSSTSSPAGMDINQAVFLLDLLPADIHINAK